MRDEKSSKPRSLKWRPDKKDINWSFAFDGLFVSRHDFGADNDRLPVVSRRQPLMGHLAQRSDASRSAEYKVGEAAEMSNDFAQVKGTSSFRIHRP